MGNFDPDAFLASGSTAVATPTPSNFNPDAFLAQGVSHPASSFNPDTFLAATAPPPPPSTTPAADQAAAEPSLISRALTLAHAPSPQWLQPAEARARAFVEGAGVPGSLKEVKDFVTRSPIQDVKDIYNDVTQIPGRVANIGQTLSGSPAATVVRAPLSPEAFGVYGTAAGMLIPAAHEALKAPVEKAGTVPAPAEAPPVVGNEQFARVNKPVTSDPIVLAAHRAPDGTVFTGVEHFESGQRAPEGSEPGFVTRSGRFLNPEAAHDYALKTKQVTPQQLDDASPSGKDEGWLDANTLNNLNEGAGAAVPVDNPAPAQSTILEPSTQPEPKPVVPITEENAAQAATDIGGLSYGGVQSWPADTGIPSTLEFTITEPGKETTLSVPPGITPEELIARRDQKLADFAAKEQQVGKQINASSIDKVDQDIINQSQKDFPTLPSYIKARLESDARGVVKGFPQNADMYFDKSSPEMLQQDGRQLYDAFAPTREVIRQKYGNTVTLYRAQGRGEEATTAQYGYKNVLNYGSRELAEKYLNQSGDAGRDLISKTIPVSDIVAVYSGKGGDAYIVLNRESPGLLPPVAENKTAVTTEPHVSAIANRFTQERAAKGEIGAVVPGQGASTADLVQRGLQMPPERAAEAVSRVMQGAGTSIDDAAAIRGEEARLSQRSNQLSKVAQANPKDLNAQVAADNAFKDLTDFHNGPVARLKNDWHAQGMAMQGEIPVDLSTLNGLREKWLKDTGEAPPASIEPTLKRAAERVSKTVAEEKGAMQQLSNGIDKATRSRKFPTADEVRANIRERLGLGPCEV